MIEILTNEEIKDQNKAILKAKRALEGVNRECLAYWMDAWKEFDDMAEEIEQQMQGINHCIDVLKEMLRERQNETWKFDNNKRDLPNGFGA